MLATIQHDSRRCVWPLEELFEAAVGMHDQVGFMTIGGVCNACVWDLCLIILPEASQEASIESSSHTHVTASGIGFRSSLSYLTTGNDS